MPRWAELLCDQFAGLESGTTTGPTARRTLKFLEVPARRTRYSVRFTLKIENPLYYQGASPQICHLFSHLMVLPGVFIF